MGVHIEGRSACSFEEHTDVKHVMYDVADEARKDWQRTIFDLRS